MPRLAFSLALLVLAVGCRDSLTPAPGLTGLADKPSKVLTTVSPTDQQRIGVNSVHSCAVRPDGAVGCWGYNGTGGAPPTKFAATGSFTQVSAGSEHTCALRTDGVVECWGRNVESQAPATKVAATGSFTQVSAGYYHSCALRTDSVVECWGSNTQSQAPATKAAAAGSFTQVSANGYHNCALRSDGVVECWGYNANGQAPATKLAVSGIFSQVSAGELHTCALRSDGVVECWGFADRAPATKTATTGSFTQVGAGIHSCAVRTDGVVECWGGTGPGGVDEFNAAPATKVSSSGSFAQVSAGSFHTCAMRTDGTVQCWGGFLFGQEVVGTIPAAPVGVTATVVGAAVDVSWTDGGSAIWFRVDRRERNSMSDPWGPWAALDDIISATSFTDATVVGGKQYGYRVSACRLAGCSASVEGNDVTLEAEENVAPSVTLTALSPLTILSGESVTLKGSFTDPGLDAPWNYVFNWGNGSTSGTFAVSGAEVTASRQYFGTGTYTVTFTTTDDDGLSGTQSLDVTVARRGMATQVTPRSINLKNKGEGTITFRLTSTPDVNVALVDIASVKIGSVGVAQNVNGVYRYDLDGGVLTLHFTRAALIAAGVLTSSTTELTLLADLTSGMQIVAVGSVQVR